MAARFIVPESGVRNMKSGLGSAVMLTVVSASFNWLQSFKTYSQDCAGQPELQETSAHMPWGLLIERTLNSRSNAPMAEMTCVEIDKIVA